MRFIRFIAILLICNPLRAGTVESPSFKPQGGFHSGKVIVTLSHENANAIIRYTTNGTVPQLNNGSIYVEPLTLKPLNRNRGHVIRARAFLPNGEISETMTNTYLLNQNRLIKNCSAVVIAGASEDFFGEKGILNKKNTLKRGQDFEANVSVEYYDSQREVGIQTRGGLRLAGSDATRRSLKFLSIKSSPWRSYSDCLLYTSPSPRDATLSRMPSSA